MDIRPKLLLIAFMGVGFFVAITLFPKIAVNIQSTQELKEIMPMIESFAVMKSQHPVALLSDDTECANSTIDIENLRLMPRQFTIRNLSKLRSGNCSNSAFANIIIIEHSLALHQQHNWPLDNTSEMALDLLPNDWTPTEDQKKTWMIPVLSDSLAKVGGSLLRLSPQRSYQFLQEAKRLDTSTDPMFPGLLAYLALNKVVLINSDYADISVWIQQAARFPNYAGPRLREYIELVLPMLIEQRILADRDLANWLEYLLDMQYYDLAVLLVTQAGQGPEGNLDYDYQRSRLSAILDTAGESQYAGVSTSNQHEYSPLSNSSTAIDRVQPNCCTQHPNETNKELGCLCKINNDPFFLAANRTDSQQNSDLLSTVNWTWKTWVGINNYSSAGYVGHYSEDIVRIQGLWWESLPQQIEPRAGIVSSQIEISPRSTYILSLDYRTTGIEGTPNIYISNKHFISPTDDVFLPKTGGKWETVDIKIHNSAQESYPIQLTVRSLGLGTTWYKNIVLTPLK